MVVSREAYGYAKTRQFLRLARRIRDNARKVDILSFEFADRGEFEKATKFQLAHDRLRLLHSEIREQARKAMRIADGLASQPPIANSVVTRIP